MVLKTQCNIIALIDGLPYLDHRRQLGKLSLFYRNFDGRCSEELASLIPSSTEYSSNTQQTWVIWQAFDTIYTFDILCRIRTGLSGMSEWLVLMCDTSAVEWFAGLCVCFLISIGLSKTLESSFLSNKTFGLKEIISLRVSCVELR